VIWQYRAGLPGLARMRVRDTRDLRPRAAQRAQRALSLAVWRAFRIRAQIRPPQLTASFISNVCFWHLADIRHRHPEGGRQGSVDPEAGEDHSPGQARLIRVLRGTLGSLQFLHIVRCQFRRIEGDGHLVDLASEVERHLVVAVVHRCGTTETDVERLIEP
jgi:hypothetical protein